MTSATRRWLVDLLGIRTLSDHGTLGMLGITELSRESVQSDHHKAQGTT